MHKRRSTGGSVGLRGSDMRMQCQNADKTPRSRDGTCDYDEEENDDEGDNDDSDIGGVGGWTGGWVWGGRGAVGRDGRGLSEELFERHVRVIAWTGGEGMVWCDGGWIISLVVLCF